MARRTQKRKNIRRKTLRAKNKNIRILVGGEDKCIFVPLMIGTGLGNQLFMYAAALTVKKKLGLPLCIFPSRGSEHSSKDYRETLFTNSKSVDDLDPAIKERKNKSTTVLGNLDSSYARWVNTNIVANTSKNVMLASMYFQNYQAIKGIIPEMREQIVGALEKQFPDLKATIESDTTAFMHVRRKDFAVNGAALGKTYYQNGLNALSKLENLKKVNVFSNDLQWCKEQGFTVGNGISLELIEQPDELNAFYSMVLCKRAALISGSTFSLWAAIFGAATNTNPLILYPNIWYLIGNSSTLELPKEDEGWKVMNTE